MHPCGTDPPPPPLSTPPTPLLPHPVPGPHAAAAQSTDMAVPRELAAHAASKQRPGSRDLVTGKILGERKFGGGS